MTPPRMLAAMAAVFITSRLPLPVAGHSAYASSISQTHSGRALDPSFHNLTPAGAHVLTARQEVTSGSSAPDTSTSPASDGSHYVSTIPVNDLEAAATADNNVGAAAAANNNSEAAAIAADSNLGAAAAANNNVEGPSAADNNVEGPSAADNNLEAATTAYNNIEGPSAADNNLEAATTAYNNIEAAAAADSSLKGASAADKTLGRRNTSPDKPAQPDNALSDLLLAASIEKRSPDVPLLVSIGSPVGLAGPDGPTGDPFNPDPAALISSVPLDPSRKPEDALPSPTSMLSGSTLPAQTTAFESSLPASTMTTSSIQTSSTPLTSLGAHISMIHSMPRFPKHHNYTRTASLVQASGRLVPTSVAPGESLTTSASLTTSVVASGVTSAPARASTGAAAGSVVLSGMPNGLLGAGLLGLGFWLL